jgi:hypothetical protein
VARSANVAEVLISRGVLAEAAALYCRHFAGPACLMADARGWPAADPQVEAALKTADILHLRPIIPAPLRPKPTVDLANTLRAVLHPGETPVSSNETYARVALAIHDSLSAVSILRCPMSRRHPEAAAWVERVATNLAAIITREAAE